MKAIAALWAVLLLAGCAAIPAPVSKAPARSSPAVDPGLEVESLCNAGEFVGIVIAAGGAGVWSLEFDPREVCPRGI